MFNSVYLTALMLEKCWKEATEQEESREKHWKKEKSECNKKQREKKKKTLNPGKSESPLLHENQQWWCYSCVSVSSMFSHHLCFSVSPKMKTTLEALGE